MCLEGNGLGKLKLPIVFPLKPLKDKLPVVFPLKPLKDCFCFYLDVFTPTSVPMHAHRAAFFAATIIENLEKSSPCSRRAEFISASSSPRNQVRGRCCAKIARKGINKDRLSKNYC